MYIKFCTTWTVTRTQSGAKCNLYREGNLFRAAIPWTINCLWWIYLLLPLPWIFHRHQHSLWISTDFDLSEYELEQGNFWHRENSNHPANKHFTNNLQTNILLFFLQSVHKDRFYFRSLAFLGSFFATDSMQSSLDLWAMCLHHISNIALRLWVSPEALYLKLFSFLCEPLEPKLPPSWTKLVLLCFICCRWEKNQNH